jgi:hypothetical protein
VQVYPSTDRGEARPIFIVGSPRSGTTLLRLMLDAHPHISCGPETSFLIDMERIVRHHWSHIELYGFSREYWRDKIARFFASFQVEYAARRGKRRWADKTPHYTPHMDFIAALFPDAQFVHIIRDGRDVVASCRQRWGYGSAFRGIQRWKAYVSAARAFGQRAPADQYHELRYEDLVANAEGVVRDLLAYLHEPWDERVLDYMRAPHDIQPTYPAHVCKRRISEAGQGSIYASRVGAWRRELDPVLKLAVYLWAGKLLRELGYVPAAGVKGHGS